MTEHPAAASWERLLREQAILADVYRHARAEYPNECCGFIHASGKVHHAENCQDALHSEDPARWPRSAREAYSLSPSDLYALGMSFLSDDPAIVVYHSHPDVGAYFSEKDERDALIDGRPVYDVDHLVIDVQSDGAKGAKLFRFAGPGFVCIWSQTLQSAPDDLTRLRSAETD